MKKLITLLLFGWLVTFTAAAQVTFSVSPTNTTADPGQNISIDITTDNFTDIIAFQFTMGWDDAVLQLNDVTTHGNIPGYSYPGSFGPANVTDYFTTNWLDNNLNPTTLSNGTVIATMNFTVVGGGGTSSPLEFLSSPLSTEVTDNTFSIVPSATNNGMVTINGGTTGGTPTFLASDETGANGSSGSVKISVQDFTNVEGFQYTIEWDPAIISFDSVGAINLVEMTATGNFGTTQSGNGILDVSWNIISTPNPVTLPDNTVIFEIFYTVVGGNNQVSPVDFTGNSTTIEIIVNNTPSQNVAFDNGSYTATGMITGGGGITFIASDEAGGNGDQVCVDVTVEDFNQIISAQYTMEFDETIATFNSIQFGNGNPLALSEAANFGTTEVGNGILNFSWLDAALLGVTLPNQTSIYEVCFDIVGSSGQTSSVDFTGGSVPIEVTDVNSPPEVTFNSVSGSVDVTGVFSGLNLEFDCVDAGPGDNICVDVAVVSGFDQIVSIQYDMEWDPAVLDFTGVQYGNGNPLSLTEVANFGLTNTANGTAAFSWLDNALVGVTLGNTTSLYQMCFNVTGSLGQSSVIEFTGTTTPMEVSDGNGFIIDFQGDPCTVNVSQPQPLNVADTTITNVDCFGDATGAIDITVAGGAQPYTYNWGVLGNNPDVTGLTAGTYFVTISDNDGTVITETYIVTEPSSALAVSANAMDALGGNDGSIDITATGGTTPYSYAWSTGSTNEDLTNLSPNTYTVTVTDGNGCTVWDSWVISDCPTITVNFNENHVSCFGGNDGSATANPNGGVAPYTYFWAPSGTSNQTLSGALAGTYTVTATDANGCTGTGEVTLTEPTDLTVSTTKTDLNCNGNNSGSIDLTVNGGTAGYTYLWSNGATTQDLNGVAAGTYTPTVTDAEGCIEVGAAVTLTEPSAIVATPTITNATCFGDCDGSISLAITGGTGGYTVNWSNQASGTSVTGLCAGNISVTIVDGNGCSISEIYTITQPEQIVLSYTVVNESVAGNDGEIDLSVDPNGPYTYLWSNGLGTTQDLTGLVAGSYTVTVTNTSTGCTASVTVPVSNTLGIQSSSIVDVLCNGESTGAINIVTYGGTEPHGWQWSANANNATTESVNGLSAGTYTVTITEAMGTSFVETFTIEEPAPIGISAVIDHESNFNDGGINITPTGGTLPYTYVWSITGPNGSPIISEDLMNVPDGCYNVTVTDANGCAYISDQLCIAPALPTAGAIVIEDVSCNGLCDGSITINIVGGDPPFILNGPNNVTVTATAHNYTFPNLCPGTYNILGVDDDGIGFSFLSIEVEEPPVLGLSSAIITNKSCGPVCDGGVNITPTGGTPPYSYLWSNGDVSQDLSNACVGSYNVQITDAKGCIFQSPEYQIVEMIEGSFTITNIACNGEFTGIFDINIQCGMQPYNYIWTDSNGDTISTAEDLTNIGAGTYTVTVTDMMGLFITLSGTVNQPAAPLGITSVAATPPMLPGGANGSIDITVTGGTNPYSYLWQDEFGNDIATTQDLEDLIGGTYYVTVTDNNGCTDEASINLPGIVLPLLKDTSLISCVDMCDAYIRVEGSLGESPYTYEWNTGATTQVLNNLCEGVYEVTVTDFNGVQGFATFDIVNPAPIQIQLDTDPGHAEAIVTGGTPEYLFTWDNEMTTDSFIDDLIGGLHRLKVTDQNGCESEEIFFEVPYNTDCIRARAVISPNEDGKNDVFYINCIEDFENHLMIYNRWGQLVFEADNYDNSWAGKGRRDQDLPEGGYFYILEYTDANGTLKQEKGAISIVR